MFLWSSHSSFKKPWERGASVLIANLSFSTSADWKQPHYLPFIISVSQLKVISVLAVCLNPDSRGTSLMNSEGIFGDFYSSFPTLINF